MPTLSPRSRTVRHLVAGAVLVVMGVPAMAAPASAAPGAIVVTPSTDLADGQAVAITGSGWTPGNTIGFCQAVQVDPVSTSNCASGSFRTATADGSGNIADVLVVRRVIQVPSLGRDVDCAVEACVVGAADSGDLVGTAVLQPISFVAVPTTPSAPTIGSATAGFGSATVSWTASVSDGLSPIIGYIVTPLIGYLPQGPRYFVSTATTQTVTGLADGTTYRFRVRAWNAIGVSGFSGTSNPVVPAVVAPGAPTIGTATAGNDSAVVTWTAPTSDGGSPITGYVVTPYSGYFPLAARLFDSNATSQTVNGLANGNQYRFRVQAINGIGPGAYSRATNPVTPTA